MTIITISRGSYSHGDAVAAGVAKRLGYDCISREVLLEAADAFDVPEGELLRAVRDGPSVMERFTRRKTEYIAHVQCALTNRTAEDNVVYHGVAGHLLLEGIPHVLRVRIIADMAARIAYVMDREHVTQHEAAKMIQRIDDNRERWTRWLYGVTPEDPKLYDLVVHIDKLQIADAIAVVCQTATAEAFKSTEKSLQKMNDLALACRMKSALLDTDHTIAVTCEYGNVVIFSQADARTVRRLEERLRMLAETDAEIHHAEVREKDQPPTRAV